jgi:hypothetical protein
VPRWPVVVRDDRLGTSQWQWVVGSSRREREREVYRERMSSGCNQPLEGPVPSLSSLTTTGHLGTGLLYKPRSFRAWLTHP